MDCSKCQDEAAHSVLIRKSDLPHHVDPDASDRFKSKLHVAGLCKAHWQELKEFLGLT